MISRRSVLLATLAASTSRVLAADGTPITVTVPFAPGASADGIARMIGSFISENLKSTVVVENKPGGGGATGLISLSRSSADGSAIGIGATGAIAINPHVAGAPPFDPLKQLVAIAKLVDIPLVLVANPATGIRTIDDVVAKSKQKPDGLTFGSTGVNSSQHLSIEVLKQMTGANLTHVPYRGSAPATTDLIGGQIPLACVDLTSVVEQIKAGNAVPVGVTAAQRYSVLPDVRTFAEQGMKGFDVPAWLGMFGPAELSAADTEKIADVLEKAISSPEIVARVKTLACEPAYLRSKQFAAYLGEQSGKMKMLVKQLDSK